jgi:hypothetical protein
MFVIALGAGDVMYGSGAPAAEREECEAGAEQQHTGRLGDGVDAERCGSGRPRTRAGGKSRALKAWIFESE